MNIHSFIDQIARMEKVEEGSYIDDSTETLNNLIDKARKLTTALTYKVTLTLEFEPLDRNGDETLISGYPAGWLEGAITHLFETYNDDESLKAVHYQFEGMDKPQEVGPV